MDLSVTTVCWWSSIRICHSVTGGVSVQLNETSLNKSFLTHTVHYVSQNATNSSFFLDEFVLHEPETQLRHTHFDICCLQVTDVCCKQPCKQIFVHTWNPNRAAVRPHVHTETFSELSAFTQRKICKTFFRSAEKGLKWSLYFDWLIGASCDAGL